MLERRDLSMAAGALLLALLTVPPPTSASDWPQQRGPSQSGAVPGTGILPPDGFAFEIAWKRPLGSGHSEVVVVGDLAVTLFSDGESDLLGAFDVDSGEERWRYVVGPMYEGHSGSSDGPTGTPTVADGVVYGIDPHGRFFAVRLADGEEIWARSLEPSEATIPHWGFASVPVVAGESLIVVTGGPPGRTISAYRRSDGSLLWSRGEDTVNYQSPILVEVAGRTQLVTATDHLLLGLDPADGEVLWQHQHTEGRAYGYGQPVALGGGRFAVSLWESNPAFEVSADDGGYQVRELWRSEALRHSYTIPVRHQGYLYGTYRRFLTCADAATGETVWRSRPPGGIGLLLLDGHLVMLSWEGEVVAAEASPEGYREKARLKVFERGYVTPLSFANGRLFARNLEELAAIDVVPAPGASTARSEPVPDFSAVPGTVGAALRKIAAAPAQEKTSLVDELLARHPSLPAIDPDGTVHFLYRGDVTDVAVLLLGRGLMGEGEQPLERVPETDLFHTTIELDPDSYWQYVLRVDMGEPGPDPGNPHRLGPASELRMPGWKVPRHVEEPAAGRPRGRVVAHTLESEAAGGEQAIRVYLPPEYDGSDRRYPVYYLNGGDQALARGQIDNSLDNLIGDTVEPLIAVLLPSRRPELVREEQPSYRRMVVEELVPFIDRTYRTQGRPEGRAVGGVGSGAFAAVDIAVRHPDLFGKLAVQSFYVLPEVAEETFTAVRGATARPLTVFVEQNRHDYYLPRAQTDARAGTRQLIEALRAGGHRVVVQSTAGAPLWGHWRAQYDRILGTLFPLGGGG